MKQIVYFLAEFREQIPCAQESEVSDIQLMSYERAMDIFQFESSKWILREANSFLKK